MKLAWKLCLWRKFQVVVNVLCEGMKPCLYIHEDLILQAIAGC